jgi:hypothetical protein
LFVTYSNTQGVLGDAVEVETMVEGQQVINRDTSLTSDGGNGVFGSS